jgi:hypothetical protein
MSHALALFVVSALLTFGIGSFLLCLVLAVWRHVKWSRRARRRIGWYS